jgi:hypothetical protein
MIKKEEGGTERAIDQMVAKPHTVGSKSIAMFCSFGLFAVWRFMEWKSHLAL